MTWGLRTGNIYFIVEIFLAELIFLYPVPRHKNFWAKLAAGCLAVTAIAAFLPQITVPELQVLSEFMRFFGIFALSVLAMGLCFSLKPDMLVSMCVAGYAVQQLSYRIAWLLSNLPLLTDFSAGDFTRMRLFEITVMPLMYIVIFFTFGRFSQKNECYKNSDRRFNFLSILIVFICVGLSRVPAITGESGRSVTNSIYSAFCCFLALYVQFILHRLNTVERENAAMELVRREEKKQYEFTKTAIDSLNIKLHDLKHKLTAYNVSLPPEEIESLRQDINIYDSKLKTGNDTLDVLLTEKILKCQMKQIRLTISGDSAPLSFVKTMDLYSLFGNAIDNAIEAVEQLEEEKRIIDISIEERGDLIFLGFTNYYSGTLIFEDDIPQTSKAEEKGYHGFGMKSMKLIAARYGGELIISANDELFNLNIYLRKPQ